MLNIRIEKELREKYSNYCKSNGFSISKRLRALIEKDIEGKIKVWK